MSFKSQEANMRRLAELLSHDLGYIWGERECGPNGDKKTFLNVGKTFLRALGKDLGLRDVKVVSNAGGIAVSGECTLIGMWEDSGIYISIQQPYCMGQDLLLYRTVRHIKDYKGGYNNFVGRRELSRMSYAELLNRLLALRKVVSYERAA
jgi:hypothetical protein